LLLRTVNISATMVVPRGTFYRLRILRTSATSTAGILQYSASIASVSKKYFTLLQSVRRHKAFICA
jgi:hypothetical protein